MKKTVHEVARLYGISVRTLHYYDEIGLLKPGCTTQAGYRQYGEEEIERLAQILYLRELDFPLREIGDILDSHAFSRSEALIRQRKLLLLKRDRLDRLIAMLDSTLKGESHLNLQEYDMRLLEEEKRKYADEVKARWGDTAAYEESEHRVKQYTGEQWQSIQKSADDIFTAFAAHMDQDEDPASEAVQELVKRWQDHITQRYYPCDRDILAGLGEMYTGDERFTKSLDERYGEGVASFVSRGIAAYCER